MNMLKVSTVLLTLAEPVVPESGDCPGRKNHSSLSVRQISELRADRGLLSSALFIDHEKGESYGKEYQYKNRKQYIYKKDRADNLCCSISF